MRKTNRIFHWPVLLTMIMTAVLQTACQPDASDTPATHAGDDAPEGLRVHLVSYADSYAEQTLMHRAAPTGFTAYAPTKVTDMGIYVLLPADYADPQEQLIKYVATWHAYFQVEKGKTYNVYGYMPKTGSIGSSLVKDNEDTAVLTISNIKPVTTEDICFITGVKESETGLQEGSFSWRQDIEKDDYYIYLLMNHLYASVQFRLTINEDYAQLRTVKLKDMTLRTDRGSVNATISLAHNNTGASPVTSVSYAAAGGSEQTSVYDNAKGQALNILTPIAIDAYFAPTLSDRLTLVSTYDVYDRKGNLIRANCTATNKIPDLEASRGQRVQVNMTVNPTYLYTLSDQDLDNIITIDN